MKNPIVILTGAGISAESGLKTFRDANGLWEGHQVEDIATPIAFGRNASLVHDFYNKRRRQLLTVSPNKAHQSLAHLANNYNGSVHIITQNVDDLHERAGSINVLHMHGQLFRKKCVWCDDKQECRDDLGTSQDCEKCSRNGGMRPDIVWFGETPYHLEEIDDLLASAGTFISIGTSGQVYPAANFVVNAKKSGAKTIELNKESTHLSRQFHESRLGPATETVPQLVTELLA